MALKQLLDKIASLLPADADVALTSLLADARREASIVLSDKESVNKEAKSHREKADAYKAEIDTLKAEIEKLSNDTERKADREDAAKYKQLMQQQETETISKWNEAYKTLMSITETDKRHAKVKELLPDLIVPEEGKELSVADAQANLKLYQSHERLGTFKVETQNPGGNPPLSTNIQTPATKAEAYQAVIQRK